MNHISKSPLFLHSQETSGKQGLVSELMSELSCNRPGPMCFGLLSNRAVFGILLKETVDSFLVALPATMSYSEDEVVAEPYVEEPVFRLLKGGLLLVSKIPTRVMPTYCKYLSSNSQRLPDLLYGETLLEVESLASRPQEVLDEDDAPEPWTHYNYNKTTRH